MPKRIENMVDNADIAFGSMPWLMQADIRMPTHISPEYLTAEDVHSSVLNAIYTASGKVNNLAHRYREGSEIEHPRIDRISALLLAVSRGEEVKQPKYADKKLTLPSEATMGWLTRPGVVVLPDELFPDTTPANELSDHILGATRVASLRTFILARLFGGAERDNPFLVETAQGLMTVSQTPFTQN